MKTSNKILLIAFCALAGLILIVVVVARIAWGPAAGDVAPGERISREISIADFTGIRVNSVWEVDVKQGDTFSVMVTIPENLADLVIVEKRGSWLVLDQRGRSFNAPEYKFRAEIVMPALERLDCSGVSAVTITGFTLGDLEVFANGVGSIVALGTSVENLRIVLSGVGSVDFSTASVKNADVDLSGMGSLKVRMDGGVLRGQLSGMGSIEYSGAVSSQEIEKTGLGSVQRE